MMSKETQDLGVFSGDEQIRSFGVPDLTAELLSKETRHSIASSEDRQDLGKKLNYFGIHPKQSSQISAPYS